MEGGSGRINDSPELGDGPGLSRRARRRGGGQRPTAAVRERQRPLRVVVSVEERAEIQTRARATGLSVSAYLRALGLGHEPRSVYDLAAVDTLAQVNGDLGRLGGLLKLWLGERPGQGARIADVESLLRHTRELQRRMLELMARV